MKKIKDFIELLIDENLLSWSKEDFNKIVVTLIFISSIFLGAKRLVKYFINLYSVWTATKIISPIYSSSEIREATKNFIETKCQNVSPTNYSELKDSHAYIAKENMFPYFNDRILSYKNGSENKDNIWTVVLGDTGMGKTTFLINLVISFRRKKIFNLFDALNGKEIFMIPLAHPSCDKLILSKEENSHETILLLDGLDEDPKAIEDYKNRIHEIINLTTNFFRVVITCRSQFFDSVNDEPYETGIFKYGGEKGRQYFLKLYVSPFDDNDVDAYLRKRYSILHLGKRRKAKKIVKDYSYLVSRPLLLSYIGDLVDENSEYRHRGDLINVLIQKWIDREESRYMGSSSNFNRNMLYFSMSVAGYIYGQQKVNAENIYITKEKITSLAKENGIELNEIVLKSKSFLNRNSNGEFKFSHKVFLEYFVALKMIYDKEFSAEYYEAVVTDPVANFYEDISNKIKRKILEKYPDIRITYVTVTGIVHHDVSLASVKVGSCKKNEVIELVAADKKYDSVTNMLIQLSPKIGREKPRGKKDYLRLQKEEINRIVKEINDSLESFRNAPPGEFYISNSETSEYYSHIIKKLKESDELITDLYDWLEAWRQTKYVIPYKVRKEFFQIDP